MLWVRAGAQRYGGYGASLQAYPPPSFLPRLFSRSSAEKQSQGAPLLPKTLLLPMGQILAADPGIFPSGAVEYFLFRKEFAVIG